MYVFVCTGTMLHLWGQETTWGILLALSFHFIGSEDLNSSTSAFTVPKNVQTLCETKSIYIPGEIIGDNVSNEGDE